MIRVNIGLCSSQDLINFLTLSQCLVLEDVVAVVLHSVHPHDLNYRIGEAALGRLERIFGLTSAIISRANPVAQLTHLRIPFHEDDNFTGRHQLLDVLGGRGYNRTVLAQGCISSRNRDTLPEDSREETHFVISVCVLLFSGNSGRQSLTAVYNNNTFM